MRINRMSLVFGRLLWQHKKFQTMFSETRKQNNKIICRLIDFFFLIKQRNKFEIEKKTMYSDNNKYIVRTAINSQKNKSKATTTERRPHVE